MWNSIIRALKIEFENKILWWNAKQAIETKIAIEIQRRKLLKAVRPRFLWKRNTELSFCKWTGFW